MSTPQYIEEAMEYGTHIAGNALWRKACCIVTTWHETASLSSLLADDPTGTDSKGLSLEQHRCWLTQVGGGYLKGIVWVAGLRSEDGGAKLAAVANNMASDPMCTLCTSSFSAPHELHCQKS